MPDSWNAFWERLIVGVVGVIVISFVAQGVWFSVTDLLASVNPGLEAGLIRTSSRLGVPWILATAGGVAWVGWRAWGEVEREPVRR